MRALKDAATLAGSILIVGLIALCWLRILVFPFDWLDASRFESFGVWGRLAAMVVSGAWIAGWCRLTYGARVWLEERRPVQVERQTDLSLPPRVIRAVRSPHAPAPAPWRSTDQGEA